MATKRKNTKRKTTKRKSGNAQKPALFWRACRWLLILGIWGGLFTVAVVAWYAKDLPAITRSATFERRTSIVVKASDGSVLARYGERKGRNTDVNELPDHLVNAVLAIEDRRFYDHFGIDPLGIARALVTNTIKGRAVQGGSTITQQLAKNLYLTHERKLERKIKEAILSLWIEHELSKDEILSAYMNRVYLGSGSYGFEAAAQLYFGKSARLVNLREASMLAGLLKAPSKYSPHYNPDKAQQRANVVLAAMIDAGYITKDEAENAKTMKVSLPNKKSVTGQNARYFTDWILDGIDELVGQPDMDLVIETTLDAGLQDYAQMKLKNAIDNAPEENLISQGAILVTSPDGAVRGMVGGYDFGQSQFNRATQAIRPPGSAFKPFIYLTALQKGWHANDMILDAPITEGKYRPKNFASKYYGEVSLQQALALSMNTAAVRLADEVGIGEVLQTARHAGVLSKQQRDLSSALGSSGVSLLEMSVAYATIANGGHRVFPYGITRVTDNDGNLIYQRKTPSAYQSIFPADNIAELTMMMQSVVTQGTGRRAQLPFAVAGKTGTSQDSRDAWFAGFSNNLVGIVWLGNDDNSPMRHVTGGGLPAEIWKDVIRYGHNRHSRGAFPSVDTQNIDQNGDGGFSGMLNRLFSSSGNDNKPSGWKPTKRKDDFSNLNN